TVRTQPLEYFDINEYGSLWNPAWKLDGAARGGPGATYLDGDVLVTFPRDTRPCRLESMMKIPDGSPQLVLHVAAEPSKPWRLSVYVDDDRVADRRIEAGENGRELKWTEVKLDLAKYAGRSVDLRAYHYLVPDKAPGSAYWKSIQIQ